MTLDEYELYRATLRDMSIGELRFVLLSVVRELADRQDLPLDDFDAGEVN